MRIDLFLNKVCLTKTRSVAKNACDKNLVKINAKLAKASTELREGDEIGLRLYGFDHQIKVLALPTGNVAKKDATNYYQLLSRQEIPSQE